MCQWCVNLQKLVGNVLPEGIAIPCNKDYEAQMARARINDGKWTRFVPPGWCLDTGFRSHIFKSVLARPDLREEEFILEDGVRVTIPVDEIRRIVVNGKDHYRGASSAGPTWARTGPIAHSTTPSYPASARSNSNGARRVRADIFLNAGRGEK